MDASSTGSILVATDLSAASDAAVDQAILLAWRMAAPLEILHVLELPVEIPFGPTFLDAGGGNPYARIAGALADLTARAAIGGVASRTKILEGSPAIEINKRARELAASLVVIGTHGRTGLAHAVLGSVAERVIRHASCPVLTVPFASRAA
jgi:nucleotide-binding universal stress UspA family protein